MNGGSSTDRRGNGVNGASGTNGSNGREPTPAWHGLEVRHLLAFLAVAEEGTFSRASTRLGYTQSAVSQQIAALERMVSATLFERPGGPRRTTLTPEGTALLPHARAVVGRVGEAAAELRSLTSAECGSLTVGTIQSVGRRILPALLGRFRSERPHVAVNLRESEDPNNLLDRMAQGELDLMFAPLPVPEGAFDIRVLLDEPFVLLAPADSPEAARPSITIQEVAQLPLVGYRSTWCRSIQTERFGGVDPRFMFESDDNGTSQGLVGAGGVYWCASLLSVDRDDPRTVVLPIDPPVAPRQLTVLLPNDRHLPAAVEPFVETAARVCEDLAAELTLSP